MAVTFAAGSYIVTNDRAGRTRLVKALMDFSIEDLEAAGCVRTGRWGVQLIDLNKVIAKGFFVEDVACHTLFVV